MVDPSENVGNRQFILWEGDLVYAGDKSAFVIKNFLQNKEIKAMLTKDDIVSISGITGDIMVQHSHTSQYVFSGGRYTTTLALNAATVNPIASIEVPEEAEFRDLTKAYQNCRDIYTLMEMQSTVNSISNEEVNAVMLFDSAKIALSHGADVLDVNLTNIPDVLRKASSLNAKFATVKNKLYIKSIIDGMEVLNIISVSKPIMLDAPLRIGKSIISGEVLADSTIKCVIDGAELNTLTQKAYLNGITGYIGMHITPDTIEYRIQDQHMRMISITAPAQCNDSVQFKVYNINAGVLNFVTAPCGGLNKSVVCFNINPDTRSFMITAEPKPSDTAKKETAVPTIHNYYFTKVSYGK